MKVIFNKPGFMHTRHAATTAFGLGFCLFLAAPARAGNDGYFTTYNSKVEGGEVELMLMNDFTQPSRFRREKGQGDYFSHMLELEYGVTNQFATELMIESFEDIETGEAKFGGFRWENRFRLFPHAVPLNPMIYAEYEDLDPSTRYKMEVSGWVRPPYNEQEHATDRERVMETRLVLSQDFGPVNLAFNWINETEIPSGDTAFGYSAGAMWMIHRGTGAATAGGDYVCPMHPSVTSPGPGSCPTCGMALVKRGGGHGSCRCAAEMPGCACGHCGGKGGACPCGHAGMIGLGLELYGGLGDARSFALDPARQEHYLGPIFMAHITNHWMVHTQLAIGLTAASDNLVRLNIGYEL